MIEPEEVVERTGYTRPHTMHCGPDGIYVSALGNADGDGPGGIFMMDHDTFDVSATGKSIAGRSTSPTTSGGISATTPWSPASGARRT